MAFGDGLKISWAFSTNFKTSWVLPECEGPETMMLEGIGNLRSSAQMFGVSIYLSSLEITKEKSIYMS
jgi:hypothetical protein